MEDFLTKMENWNNSMRNDSLKFVDKIGEKYTIREIVSFLKTLEFGKEQSWIDELIKILREVLEPDDKMFTLITTARCFVLTFPRLIHAVIHPHIFVLQNVCEVGFERISELKSADEDFKVLYRRINTTIQQASMSLVLHNASKISNNDEWTIVKPLEEHLAYRYKGEKIIDIGAWEEYMQYLETETDVLKPPEEISTCLMM